MTAANRLYESANLQGATVTADAVKRVILAAFPGCFSATVIDSLQ